MNGAFNPHRFSNRRTQLVVEQQRIVGVPRARPESSSVSGRSDDGASTASASRRPVSRLAAVRSTLSAAVRIGSPSNKRGATSARATNPNTIHSKQDFRYPQGDTQSPSTGAKGLTLWSPTALLHTLGLTSGTGSNSRSHPQQEQLGEQQQQQQGLVMPATAHRRLLAGDLRGAQQALEEALARAVRKHGADSTQVADLMFSHGQVWTDTASAFAIGGLGFPEDASRAVESAERARDAFETVLRVHSCTGNRLVLAHTHRALMTLLEDGPSPDYEEAEAHAEQALQLFQRRFGPAHDETCAALQDLSRLRLRTGQARLVAV